MPIQRQAPATVCVWCNSGRVSGKARPSAGLHLPYDIGGRSSARRGTSAMAIETRSPEADLTSQRCRYAIRSGRWRAVWPDRYWRRHLPQSASPPVRLGKATPHVGSVCRLHPVRFDLVSAPATWPPSDGCRVNYHICRCRFRRRADRHAVRRVEARLTPSASGARRRSRHRPVKLALT